MCKSCDRPHPTQSECFKMFYRHDGVLYRQSLPSSEVRNDTRKNLQKWVFNIENEDKMMIEVKNFDLPVMKNHQMNHTTVAHYASIPYPIPNIGRGVVFLDDTAQKLGLLGKYAKSDGKWSPAWKICPVCNERKLFARANNKVCSRKCASIDMWDKRKETNK